MSKTPIYDSEHLQSNSASPEVPVNEMIDVIERAANATVDWTVTGDFTATKAQMAGGFTHNLTGSPAAAFAFGVPAVARRFEVVNDTGQTCTVYVQGSSGGGADVADGETVTLRSDGVNVTAVSSAATPGGSGIELIQSISMSGIPAASFTAIPQTYTHLLAWISGRSSAGSSPGANIHITFNGDSGANYDQHSVATQSSSTSGGGSAGLTSIDAFLLPWSGATANNFGWGEITVFNYTDTNGFKPVKAKGQTIGATSVGATWLTRQGGGLWRSTAAINRMDLTFTAGNGAPGTIASLYGVP